ncbi:hypothetical protein R6Z07F_002030 [Ovis aries]
MSPVELENFFISHKPFEDFKITIKARENLNDSRKEMMLEATQKTKLIDGVAQIIFNTAEAIENLSYKSLKDLNNKYLSIFVEIQESTGRLFQETKLTDVKYVLSPYSLDLVATSLFLKPGIPYSIKVTAAAAAAAG